MIELVPSINVTCLRRATGGRKSPIVAPNLGFLLTWKQNAQVQGVYVLPQEVG